MGPVSILQFIKLVFLWFAAWWRIGYIVKTMLIIQCIFCLLWNKRVVLIYSVSPKSKIADIIAFFEINKNGPRNQNISPIPQIIIAYTALINIKIIFTAVRYTVIFDSE